ncbi:RidA family protein [Mucilaginibacter sp.]|uniref:RidA family protein n=1 Tax=Mucilaginibacter sp. TaxID=1882438 RepID=UPI0025DF4498|nr:RidA family protein [Mucilaginibacter sp.]
MKSLIRKALLLTLTVLLGKATLAQQKQFINPDSLPPLSKNYSQAVKVSGGNTIYIAGQASVNGKKEIIGRGDFKTQVITTLANLRTVLSASKATPADLVKINIYVVDLSADKLLILRDELKNFVTDNPPVSTLIGVQALFNKDAMIEIDGIAVTK